MALKSTNIFTQMSAAARRPHSRGEWSAFAATSRSVGSAATSRLRSSSSQSVQTFFTARDTPFLTLSTLNA